MNLVIFVQRFRTSGTSLHHGSEEMTDPHELANQGLPPAFPPGSRRKLENPSNARRLHEAVKFKGE